MSHAIDFSLGKAAIAYKAKNGTPWHGFGAHIESTDTPDMIAEKAGLNYRVEKAPAFYNVPNLAFDPSKPVSDDNQPMLTRSYENRAVLYRTDTLDPLSVMSESHYTPAQPIEILNGLFELTKNSGFEIDVAGALKDGKVVWALAAKTDSQGAIGKDIIKPYVLLLSSYDGTYARTARLTSVRVVCQNTLSFSQYSDGRTTSKQRNSSEFDLSKSSSLLSELGQYDKAFGQYMEELTAMSKVKLNDDKLKRFIAKLYAPEAFKDSDKWQTSELDFGRDKVSTNAKNNVASLLDIFRDSPGSALPSANGTLFGALNAVTFYQDHAARTKGDKRWESATIGNGNRAKDKALELAQELIA